uniref:Glycosyltransferase n=1 Tax=Oryza nivara TaxID=4536 RepID=A0A0E0G460_ORYNI
METFTADDQRDADAPRPPRVVLLASPGAGHLIPLAGLARRLADHHGVAPTLVTFADLEHPDARSAVLSSLPASVATATLPAVPLDDLPADAGLERTLFEVVHRSLPNLRALLRSAAPAPLAALVPDFFCAAALPVAAELGVPGYVFVPTSLAALSLMRRTVELHDGAAAGEQRALPDPLELPGGVSLRNAEVPRGFRDSTAPVYGQLLATGRLYRLAAGFLANTFYELEPAAVEEFKKAAERGTFPPAYPVGPFVRSSSDEPGESACLEWLDLQPAGSVVFVSFGSAGMLSVEQTRELAAGLEMSGHRFLWVVRMPSFNGESFAFGKGAGDEDDRRVDDDPLAWLPDGFLERTSGRGLAVAAWAPQVRVLSHPATAAFVSHCGWNSTLESVAAGVPMIAWPLHAEQSLNAVVLEESVGVAVRPRSWEEDDVVGGAVMRRGEIAAAVREVMEGEKGRVVRRRARELKLAAGRVWSPEGSSRRALEEVAGKWKAAATTHK